MTREEEINKASDELFNSAPCSKTYKIGFEAGVKWADANPKSSWISVNEKLPPEEEDGLSIKVLVTSNKGNTHISRYDYNMVGWISPILDIVFTHWMFIPELTKRI